MIFMSENRLMYMKSDFVCKSLDPRAPLQTLLPCSPTCTKGCTAGF